MQDKDYYTKEEFQIEMNDYIVESAEKLREDLRERWKENAEQVEYV